MYRFVLLVALIPFYCVAETPSVSPYVHAQVTETGDPSQKVLFTFERNDAPAPQGMERHQSKWFNDQKQVFMTEDILFKGPQFETYSVNLPLLDESAEIRVVDGKVVFKHRVHGEEHTRTEDWASNYVVAPRIVAYAHAHWDEIQRGDSVRVRMIVPDRAESLGFKFVKDGTEVWNGRKIDRIYFKPTNLFISMIVRPIKFYFDSVSRQALKISGRTILKKKTKSGWEDFQADTVFVK